MSRCISKLCSHSSSFANEGLEQKVEKKKKTATVKLVICVSVFCRSEIDLNPTVFQLLCHNKELQEERRLMDILLDSSALEIP